MHHNTKENNLNNDYFINTNKFNSSNNYNEIFIHDDNSKLPIIDQIYKKIGFDTLQYSSFFSFGFFLFADGFYMSLIPSTMMIFKDFYNANDNTIAFVTSVLFITFAISCIVSSMISSKFSRRSVLLLSLVIHIPSGILLSTTSRLELCILSLSMIGFSLGLSIPILSNNLAEVLTINLRAFIMIFVWIFFTLAQLFFPISMTFLVPNFEAENYPGLLKLGTSLVSFLLICSFFMYIDSPRNLLLTKDYDKAFDILESNLKMHISKKTKHAMVDSITSDVISKKESIDLKQDRQEEVKEGKIEKSDNIILNNELDIEENKEEKENNKLISKYQEYEYNEYENDEHDDEIHTKSILHKNIFKQVFKLFNIDYFKISIITFLLWFINANIIYGPSLIMTLTIQKLSQIDQISNENNGIENRNYEIQQIFQELYFYSTASLICLLISAVLSEINFFGRKNTLIVSYSFAGIVCIFILIFPSSFKVLIVFLGLFVSIGFNVIGSFTSELYSTDVRDTALGMCFFFNRIGAVSSQFLFLKLFRIGYLFPYGLLCLLSFLAAICSYLYPFDTLGRPLDMIK